MYTLAIFTADCSDEFDVYGFKVFEGDIDFTRNNLILDIHCRNNDEYPEFEEITQEQLDEAEKSIGYFEIGYGSNEELRFSNFKDFMRSMSLTEISEEEYQVLKKLFPRYGGVKFGFFPEC